MLTLTSMVDRTTRLFADRPAIRDPEGSFTWAAFGDRVARAAGVLRALGVRRGERYGVVARNGFRTAELMHAGYWLGAVPVPVNFRLAPPEVAAILADAGCRVVAAEDRFAALLAAGPRDVLLRIDPGGAAAPGPRYEPLLASAAPAPRAEDVDPREDALLVYTGGTTGRPKGVRLTHANVLTNALQIAVFARPRPDDVFLHVAPMFHSADLLGNPFSLVGAAHLYLPRFGGRTVLGAIEAFGVTCAMLTPTMIVVLLQEPDFARYDLSSLRQVIYGSSPMAPEWIRKAVAGFPQVEFIQAYGLTETAPLLTALGMDDHRRALAGEAPELLAGAGQPLVGVELGVVDGAGATLPPGEVGEIVARAPNVAAGYWNRPEATAEAFKGGWFHTGDVGRLDERGQLFVLDRKKDMIITGGENVYSLEVEAALHQHPGVHECAVVGVPDEVYGEALLGVVVPRPGASLCGEELIEHCRGRIGGYKIPRRYVFLDALPRSAINKVLKNELRQRFGARAAAT